MTNNWFWHTNAAKDKYGDDTISIHWGRIIITVLAVILVPTLVFGSFYTVPAGNVGVVTRFGAVNRVTYPGFNWKIPLAEHVVEMNVQTQLDQADAEAASSDLQTATSTIAINYHLDPAYAALVYQNIGVGYKDTILTPMVQNSFKEFTAAHTAEELITKRETVRLAAEADVKQKAAVYHIIVDNFQITNFKFSDQYQQAIEQKQVAQQGVETKKQILAQTEVDAQTAVAQAQGVANAKVIAAQAEAQSNDLITKSLSPQLLQYQYILKLAPGVQTIFLPSGQGQQFILPLPTTPPAGQ